MADSTPPSDIPDPASPTPASPGPKSVPGPAGGPKRIRSMPDRPGTLRTSGTINSMPTRERADTGYVTSIHKEKSWGRGLAILWSLFLVALLLEMVNATCFVLAGRPGWPLPIEAGRIALICTFFIALWAGLSWLRYLAAAVNFASGAWLLVDWILSYRATPKFKITGEMDWTIYATIEVYPKIALGLIYLATAAYIFFSYDVREFMAHRRTKGRVFPALLTTVMSYGCMLLVFAAQPIYGHWMQGMQADAQRFGDDTLSMVAQTWDGNAIFSSLDAAYAKTFTKADRETTFANFKYLGPVKSIDPAPVVNRTPQPQYPLQDKVPIPQGIESRAGAAGVGFELTATYMPNGEEFTHGRGKFGFELVRDLSGPWRITKLNVETVQYDARPKPASTPVPEGSPRPGGTDAPAASPVVAPSPGMTPIPSVAPVAAPSPGMSPASSAAPVVSTPANSAATPLISATVAPLPAATIAPLATPAATPVPTPGG